MSTTTRNSQQRKEFYASEWQDKEAERREKLLKSYAAKVSQIVENRKSYGIKLFDLQLAAARALSVPPETAKEAIDAAQQRGLVVIRPASFVSFYFTPEHAPPPDAQLYLGYQHGRGSIVKYKGQKETKEKVLQSEFY